MLSGLGKACVVIGVLLLTLGLVGFMFGGFVQGIGPVAVALALFVAGQALILDWPARREAGRTWRISAEDLKRGASQIRAPVGWALAATGIFLLASLLAAKPIGVPGFGTIAIVVSGIGISLVALGVWATLTGRRAAKRWRLKV